MEIDLNKIPNKNFIKKYNIPIIKFNQRWEALNKSDKKTDFIEYYENN